MSQSMAVEISETESDLVTRAQSAVSQCNWVVGECASKWTQKYARGRTDMDFGMLVGLSADQVFQRRRVWETFGDVATSYSGLKWSHFYVALNWDDAPECLQWSQENEATVAEMKAWRRAMHGEDLMDEAPASDWGGGSPVSFVDDDLRPVRDPDEFEAGQGGERARIPSGELATTMAGFARESEGGLPPSSAPPWEAEGETAIPRRETESSPPHGGVMAEQIVKRMTATLEKIERTITPEFAESFHELPSKLKARFLRAAEALHEKMADLGG